MLHMTVNKVILNTLTELAIPLRDRFLEGKHFSQQVGTESETRSAAAANRRVHMHTDTYTYVRTLHIYIHTYIHTYIHVH